MREQVIKIRQYPLFSRYPRLGGGSIPLDICELPTPIESMSGLGGNAWIKRDDLINPVYGGNKVRKLAWILAEVLQSNKSEVVTFGGTGTNHGVATAIFCQKFGLRSTILTFEQPPSPAVHRNQAIMLAHGAQLIPYRTLPQCVAAYVRRTAIDRRVYGLWAGGSNTTGVLSYINAAYELAQQVQLGECPLPKKIFCAVGSSATLAGLTLGTYLAGMETQVIGVRAAVANVGPISVCSSSTVWQLMKRTLFRLVGIRLGLELIKSIPRPVLLDQYFGLAYGVPTKESIAAKHQFSQLGLTQLDDTYTAKAAVAFLESINQNDHVNQKQPILFWNTYCQPKDLL